MKIDGFKNCSDPNWECYEKVYQTFRLVVSRHQRDDERDKYYAAVIDLEDSSLDVIIAENIDIKWVEMFDKLVK